MRLKTLNGAPLCENLDFSDSALLGDDQYPSFSEIPGSNALSVDSTLPLKWRSITDRATRLRTGWSQPYLPGGNTHHQGAEHSLSIPNLAEISFCVPDDSTILDDTATLNDPSFRADDFLQQSLLFYDTLLSSQVLQDTGNDSFASLSPSSFIDTSFATTASNIDSPSRVDEHSLLLRIPPHIEVTSLGSLPTAQRLSAMYPQTPTPNFICVLTVHPVKRDIFVQKGGYKRTLWEIFVADDTRSGFKVNFWVQPARKLHGQQAHAQNVLDQALGSIQVGDVILLRNIALNSFRGTVYGQSLSPSSTRARSSLDILMKSNGVEVAHTGGLPTAAVAAFLRVRRWARTHVVSETIGTRKRKGDALKEGQGYKRASSFQNHCNSLPPDTMESL